MPTTFEGLFDLKNSENSLMLSVRFLPYHWMEDYLKSGILRMPKGYVKIQCSQFQPL